MNHLDICNTSYDKKKGWESNWQFNSRALKVVNRLDPSACRWSATRCWKALDESYKFAIKRLVHILDHFYCWDKPRATQTHLTYHGPDSGEATTSPHIVFCALLHRTYIRMSLFPRLPKWSPEIVSVCTLGTLAIHNFSFQPPIGMRSKEKL
jgi:hypothetical protein